MNDALHKFVPETVFTGESKQLLLDTLTVKEEDFAPRDVGYELKLLAKRAKNSVSRKQSWLIFFQYTLNLNLFQIANYFWN